MIGIRLLQMLPTMGEKGVKDFRNSYLTCRMLPEEVESCDFEILKLKLGTDSLKNSLEIQYFCSLNGK